MALLKQLPDRDVEKLLSDAKSYAEVRSGKRQQRSAMRSRMRGDVIDSWKIGE